MINALTMHDEMHDLFKSDGCMQIDAEQSTQAKP